MEGGSANLRSYVGDFDVGLCRRKCGMNEHERHRLLLVPRKGDSAVLFGLMAATAPLQCTYAR